MAKSTWPRFFQLFLINIYGLDVCKSKSYEHKLPHCNLKMSNAVCYYDGKRQKRPSLFQIIIYHTAKNYPTINL